MKLLSFAVCQGLDHIIFDLEKSTAFVQVNNIRHFLINTICHSQNDAALCVISTFNSVYK